jgi:hypothetical protein
MLSERLLEFKMLLTFSDTPFTYGIHVEPRISNSEEICCVLFVFLTISINVFFYPFNSNISATLFVSSFCKTWFDGITFARSNNYFTTAILSLTGLCEPKSRYLSVCVFLRKTLIEMSVEILQISATRKAIVYISSFTAGVSMVNWIQGFKEFKWSWKAVISFCLKHAFESSTYLAFPPSYRYWGCSQSNIFHPLHN